MTFWERINSLFGRSQLTELIVKNNTNSAIYPDTNDSYYTQSYTGNNDVFSVINKIASPASRIPVYQVDRKTLKEKPGKGIELFNNPNPFQSRNEHIHAGLSFYLLFGEMFTAAEKPEFGLRAGKPIRLDLLPPQWTELKIGDYFEPIKGYTFTVDQTNINYPFTDVLHWKDFNPDYQLSGQHLRGMSRLKPLLRATQVSNSGYDSMVSSFQNQGAYGILTILGVKEKDGSYSQQATTKEQLSQLEESIKRKAMGNANRGKILTTNKSHEWTNLGMSPVDLNILKSIGVSKGVIYDAYNYPDILASGSEGKTYMNYQEAMKAAWNNAIIPVFDSFLQKYSDWLLPMFGEQDTMFIADYDDVPALQADKKELISWLIQARLTSNEIRVALGYDPLNLPNMDVPLITLGTQRIDEIGLTPDMSATEKTLKYLKVKDYRLQ